MSLYPGGAVFLKSFLIRRMYLCRKVIMSFSVGVSICSTCRGFPTCVVTGCKGCEYSFTQFPNAFQLVKGKATQNHLYRYSLIQSNKGVRIDGNNSFSPYERIGTRGVPVVNANRNTPDRFLRTNRKVFSEVSNISRVPPGITDKECPASSSRFISGNLAGALWQYRLISRINGIV